MVLLYPIVLFLAIYLVCAVAYYDVDALAETGIGIGVILTALAIGLLLFSGYSWLRFGAWAPVSVLEAIAFLGANPDAAISTGAWEGIGRIARWYASTNVIWTLLLGGYVSFMSMDAWEAVGRRARDAKKAQAPV